MPHRANLVQRNRWDWQDFVFVGMILVSVFGFIYELAGR
jgi:hypothetical protein